MNTIKPITGITIDSNKPKPKPTTMYTYLKYDERYIRGYWGHIYTSIAQGRTGVASL